MDDQTSLVARRYFRQGEELVSTAEIYEWNGTGTEWVGPVASITDPYNSTVSNFISALDIDGNYLIVAWRKLENPITEYVVIIYERQDSLVLSRNWGHGSL